MPVRVHEIKIRSGGFPGAPGWTTFYYSGDDDTQFANQFRQARVWLDGIKGLFPAAWSGQVQSEGRVLQTSSGALLETSTIPDDGTGNVVAGSNVGPGFGSGASGICLSYTTNGVNRGRTVRGRQFLVPINANVYEADGTIGAPWIAGMASAFLAIAVGPPAYGIWSRPRFGAGGAWFPVVACRVTDQAAVLRSRR